MGDTSDTVIRHTVQIYRTEVEWLWHSSKGTFSPKNCTHRLAHYAPTQWV